MSRWLLWHFCLTGIGIGMIGIGVSGPHLGYEWTTALKYLGWYAMGVGAGLTLSAIASDFLNTKAFT